MKSDNFFTRKFDYSESYYRLLYGFSSFFCFLFGAIALISRTSFSHTTIGKFLVYSLIFLIFASGLSVILYSNWRFKKQ